MSNRLSGLASGRPAPGPGREEAVAAAMAVAGARPRHSGRYLRAFSGVAAAAGVIVAIGFGVAHLGHDGGAKTAGRAASSESAPSAAGAAAVPAQQGLGTLTGPSDLIAAVDRRLGVAQQSNGGAAPRSGVAGTSNLAPAPASPAPSGGPGVACPDAARLFPGSSPRLLLTAGALYRGERANVYVYQVGSQRRAVAVDARTCAVLAQVPV